MLTVKTTALIYALRTHHIPELLKRDDVSKALLLKPLFLNDHRRDCLIGDARAIAVSITVLCDAPCLVFGLERDGFG